MTDAYRREYYASRGFFDEGTIRYGRKEKLFNLQWASPWAKRNLLNGESKRALDAGCGVGHNARFLQELGYRVTAVDVSEYAVQAARECIPTSLANEIEWRVADLDCDTLPKGFDLVICWEVLEHVRDPRAALAKLYSALAPGGTLVVTTPNAFGLSHLLGPRDPTHVSVHSSLWWAREARRLRPRRMACRAMMFWDHMLPWLRSHPRVLVTQVPLLGFRIRLVMVAKSSDAELPLV